MPALVISAMRARRTQTVAVFALTMLAALGVSAVPWFLAWAHDAVVATDVAAAPATARVLRVTGTATYQVGQPSPMPELRAKVEQYVDVPGSEVTVGGTIAGTMAASAGAGNTEDLDLGARDQLCAQLVIDGACPAGPGEVVVGRATAQRLHLTVGGQVVFSSFQLRTPVTLRVTGTYDPANPQDTYWTGTDLLTGSGAPGQGPAAFVSTDTMLALAPTHIMVDYHAVLPRSAFDDGGTAVERQARRTSEELVQGRFSVSSSVSGLVGAIRTDRREVRDGVMVAAIELVLLSWFVLFLAVRQASVARRVDIGLLKLRGGPRWQVWAVAGQQSAIPMLAGVVTGVALGYLAAAALARSRAALHPPDLGTTLAQSLMAAALVGVGTLIAAVVAEMSAVRSPVLSLIRRVPGRRAGWRAPVADLVVVAIALAGVYQGHAELTSGGPASPLALATPALIGLAVALVMARGLPLLAARFGAYGLASGRPGAALGALHAARRPGTERVFLVVAVAVSAVATSVFSAATALSAWNDRASLELGADRVLTVRAPSSTALLADVRAADPTGRYAMAVAYSTLTHSLAVDTTRLAAVTRLSRDYGLPDAATLAGELRPAAPAAVVLDDGPVDLDLGVTGTGPGQVTLTLAYADAAGQAYSSSVGPLADGRHPYRLTLSGCAGGCRLVSLAPATTRASATVSVYGIAQGDGGATGAVLGDVRLWHSQVAARSVGPVIASADGRLDITVTGGPPPEGRFLDAGVYFAGAAVPLPVAIAGATPLEKRAGDPRITALGAVEVPYQAVVSAHTLPRAGTTGVLMDLGSAQGVIGLARESVSLEVWLTADAPPSVLAALRASGVQVTSDSTVATRVAAFADHGPGLALRFQLLAAAVVLLLAAGSLVVAAGVERRDRAAELRTLRDQGLPERQARLAGYAATLTVVAGAVVAGIAAALVARWVAASSSPIFSDAWSQLPRPGGVAPAAFGVAVGAAVAVLVPVTVVGVRRMLRAAGRGL